MWQKAHAFVIAIYAHSATFPNSETYGLTTQLRRAAVSIPANIAEGFRRRGRSDKAKFLNIAEASLEEARYYLILARALSYGDDPALHEQAASVGRLISAYVRTLRTRQEPPPNS